MPPLSGRYLAKPVSRHDTDEAYSLWKFTFQQQVWKGININFIIDNLLNYKPDIYYWNSAPTTGRTYSIGLSMDIDDFLSKLLKYDTHQKKDYFTRHWLRLDNRRNRPAMEKLLPRQHALPA